MIKTCVCNLIWIIFWIMACSLLVWCWDSWTWSESFSVNLYWYDLEYNGKINLERVALKNDDLDEIVDLYQEIWDNSEYKDSLLVAEKYAQWLWANAFAQDNLDTLENQWLTISNVKKTQIWLERYGEIINAVLVEYEITEWLINEIPPLYVSQIFIPDENNMVLMSFITEDQSSHLNASTMFKNIK